MAKTTTTKKTTTAKPAAKKATTAKPSAPKKTATPAEVLAMLKKKYDEVFDDKSVYTVKLNNKYGFSICLKYYALLQMFFNIFFQFRRTFNQRQSWTTKIKSKHINSSLDRNRISLCK